jgi:ADP-ribose pyrophosphatase YjhB (NUDIX family)
MKKIEKGWSRKNTPIPQSKWIPKKLFDSIQKSVPIPCVDLLVLREGENGTETLLIKRKIYPEKDKWCLIGGRILINESTVQAITRQAMVELGVRVKIIKPWSDIIPFAVFNDSKSDKQKHFVVLTLPVVIKKGKIKTNGPEFSDYKWFPLSKLPSPKNTGFHHAKVLKLFKKTSTEKEIFI